MMRKIVHGAIKDVTVSLDAISLPGADLELKAITDFEDSAIGAGLLSMNKKLFDDNDQARQCVLCHYCYTDS
jgi:succinate dehydrogenase/fumarate reductase-like Fe-S protein